MFSKLSLRILCILLSSSRIQTYFSKIICLLWDLSLQLLHGPTWIALSGCQSGIIFVNVVSVFLNLDTQSKKRKSKKSIRWVADQNTINTHILLGEKSYKNVKAKPNSIHIYAICVNSKSYNLFSGAFWPSVSHYVLFPPKHVMPVSFPTEDRPCTRFCAIYWLTQNLKERGRGNKLPHNPSYTRSCFQKTVHWEQRLHRGYIV